MKFDIAHVWVENEFEGINYAWYEYAFKDPYIAALELYGCYDGYELKVAVL